MASTSSRTPVSCYDLNFNLVMRYENMYQASKATAISRDKIRTVMSKGKYSVDGLIWTQADMNWIENFKLTETMTPYDYAYGTYIHGVIQNAEDKVFKTDEENYRIGPIYLENKIKENKHFAIGLKLYLLAGMEGIKAPTINMEIDDGVFRLKLRLQKPLSDLKLAYDIEEKTKKHQHRMLDEVTRHKLRKHGERYFILDINSQHILRHGISMSALTMEEYGNNQFGTYEEIIEALKGHTNLKTSEYLYLDLELIDKYQDHRDSFKYVINNNLKRNILLKGI